MDHVWLFFGVILLAVVMRLAKSGLDRNRVRTYIESHGGSLRELTWAPFGPGWLYTRVERIYSVRYVDREGKEHQAFCKTSGWTGVYLSEDRIVRQESEPLDEIADLRAENRHLREELARLRRAHNNKDDTAITEL